MMSNWYCQRTSRFGDPCAEGSSLTDSRQIAVTRTARLARLLHGAGKGVARGRTGICKEASLPIPSGHGRRDPWLEIGVSGRGRRPQGLPSGKSRVTCRPFALEGVSGAGG